MQANISVPQVSTKRSRSGWRRVCWQSPIATFADEPAPFELPPALVTMPADAQAQALDEIEAARIDAVAAPAPAPAPAPAWGDDGGVAWRDAWRRLVAAGVDETTTIGLTCAEVMGVDAHLGRDRWPGCDAPVRLGPLVTAKGGVRPFASAGKLQATPYFRHHCVACSERHGIRITRDVQLNEAWVSNLIARQSARNAGGA